MKYLLIFLILTANILQAEVAVKDLSLISNANYYQEDQPFSITVSFKLNPGWHIYAKEPGKFGLPTEFKITSLTKISTADWQYPEPEKFEELTGDITFGYQDSADFKVQVSPDYNFKRNLDLEVEAKWLACNQELCVPGVKVLTLTLPYIQSSP